MAGAIRHRNGDRMKTSLWSRAVNSLGLLTKAEAQNMAARAEHEATVRAQRFPAELDGAGPLPLRGMQGLSNFSTLRWLADSCDAVRLCVDECKAQVLATPWVVRASDEAADTGQEEREIEQALEFLSTEGGLGAPGETLEEFLEKLLEDLLVCGCAVVYRRPTRGGKLFSVEVVDAATIKPLLSPEGWAPQADEVAYEQWVEGRKVASFTAQELYYLRSGARSNSRWGRSPTEKALSAIYQYLGWDDLTLSFLRDGDAEHTIYTTPKDWTPKQNLEFAAYLDQLNETLAKRQSKPLVVPDGVTKISARPRPEGVGETEQVHCLRRIAKAFGLNASVLGFAGETYKVAQGEQIRLAELSSKLPRLRVVSRLITDILRRDLGLTAVEFAFETLPYDRMLMANVIRQAGPERFTPNEARQLLGQSEAEGPYVDALWTSSPTGTPIILGYPKGKRPEDTGETRVAEGEPLADTDETGKAEDLRRWERKALRRLREGKGAAVEFASTSIPQREADAISRALSKATTPEQVRAAFATSAPQTIATRLAEDLESLLSAVREERGKRKGW